VRPNQQKNDDIRVGIKIQNTRGGFDI